MICMKAILNLNKWFVWKLFSTLINDLCESYSQPNKWFVWKLFSTSIKDLCESYSQP